MQDIRVLLVDDEEDIVYTMATILEMDKYTIHTATNGREALNVIDEQIRIGNSIDILVTDIAMPELSGVKLIEEIQNRELDIQILAITAFGTKSDIIELIQKGVEGYIEKPFRMSQLKKQVNKLAEKILKVKNAQEITKDEIHKKDCRINMLEQQLSSSQEFQIIGKLAGGIIHDFNNLLLAISGYADMINGILESNENHTGKLRKCQKFNSNILNATGTAQHTIDLLQSFAKKDLKKFKSINIHKVIEDVIRITLGSLKHNVVIIPELCADQPMIFGESTLLHNALLNLIINAKDAMPNGGKLLIKSFNNFIKENNCRDDTGITTYCTVSIKDTGIGIDSKVKHNIFEPFFTTKGEKGNGLGLSSVYSTVAQHNGSIEFDSEIGKGSEFRITFPVYKEQNIPFMETHG